MLPCGLSLRNRIVRAAAFAGGSVAEQASVHAEAANGGCAMSTVAYTAVGRDARTFSAQLMLTPEDSPPDLGSIADSTHAAGGKLCIQLTHAGGFAEPKLILPMASSGYPSGGGGVDASGGDDGDDDGGGGGGGGGWGSWLGGWCGGPRAVAPSSMFEAATQVEIEAQPDISIMSTIITLLKFSTSTNITGHPPRSRWNSICPAQSRLCSSHRASRLFVASAPDACALIPFLVSSRRQSWTRAATEADMDRLVQDFAAAARIAVGEGRADGVSMRGKEGGR